MFKEFRVPSSGELWCSPDNYYAVIGERLVRIDHSKETYDMAQLLKRIKHCQLSKITLSCDVIDGYSGWRFVHSNWRYHVKELFEWHIKKLAEELEQCKTALKEHKVL